MSTMEVAEDSKFDKACSIWFCPPEEKTTRELSQLSRPEREQLWADLSGDPQISQFQIKDEDPKFVEETFRQIRERLETESTANNSLGIALRQSRDYVLGKPFLLKFLRAVLFDVNEAIGLLRRHFELKHTIFSEDKLGRDILLSDLSAADMEGLRAGIAQILPTPDSAGRVVLFYRPAKLFHVGEYCPLPAMWYLYMAASNLERVQKLGVVRIVSVLLDEFPRGGHDNESLRICFKMRDAVPLRHTAIYILANPGVWTKTIELSLLFSTRFLRLRTRLISGTLQEAWYALMCVGIPHQAIPMAHDGEILLEAMHAYIQQWKKEEEGILVNDIMP